MNILKTGLLVAALVVLASCGEEIVGGRAPETVAAEPSPGFETAPSVVALNEQARREAGIEVEAVRVWPLPETIRATGRITINEEATWRVGAVTDGRIVTIKANIGDRIEQGQILAQMHSHDTHESRAQYRRAVAELDRLKAQLAYARSVRDRTQRLYDLKAASLQQVEQAETELRNAETALRNGEVELERTRVHLEEFLRVPAEVPPHDHDPEGDDYDLVPILAPADGTLLQRNITTGTMVESTGDLLVITDLSLLWMIANVSEEDLSKLRVGAAVRVFVQAYPDRAFPGRLSMIGSELNPTTRTIMARVELPNRGGRLKPEMYATAEIEVGGTREAIYVPETAVQEIEGQPGVFVETEPNKFTVRAVVTEPGANGLVEVASGLDAGDRVAVRGSFLLKSQLLKSTLAEE